MRGETEGERADPISVAFELTPEEWVDVAWEHHSRSGTFTKSMRDGQRLMGAVVVVFALLTWLSGQAFLGLVWLFAGAIAALWAPHGMKKAHLRQYRKFAEEGIANGMFGRHHVHLLDAGVLDETDAYQWLTRWHAIERVDEAAGSFLIYSGRNSFLPIPHSAFRDAETLRAFSARFFECLGSADASSGSVPSEPYRLPPSVGGTHEATSTQ